MNEELNCQICGKPNATERECVYSREVNNTKVLEIICDSCEHEHLLNM